MYVLIGSSTGVICEEKVAKRTEMENKINDEKSQKTSTHTYYRYVVPGTWPNTRVILCISKESTGLRSAGC